MECRCEEHRREPKKIEAGSPPERQRRIKEEEKANLLQKSLRTAEEKVLASIEY